MTKEKIIHSWNKLVTYYLPVYYKDSEDYFQSRIRVLITFYLFAQISYFIQVFYLWSLGVQTDMFACLIAFILNFGFLNLQKKHLGYENAGRACLVIAYSTFMVSSASAGFGVNPSMVWFFILPFASTLILGAKKGFLWTLFVASSGFLVNYFAHKWGYNYNELNPEQWARLGRDNFFIGNLTFFAFGVNAYLAREKAIKKFEKSSEERQRLLSILFHDLGNSIFICQSKTNRKLLEMKDYEGVLKETDKAHKALKMMQELIDHVKELEKIKAGKKTFDLSDVCLHDVMDGVKFVFKDRLKHKEIELSINIDSDVSYVLAEKVSLLNNVMNNFISNAIKFSKHGGKVEVNAVQEGEEVCIAIRDYGVGMPEEVSKIVFDFNKKTSTKGTEGEPGSGFGMPIAKSVVVESFGGRLEVKSQEGLGTEFKIYLQPGEVMGQQEAA